MTGLSLLCLTLALFSVGCGGGDSAPEESGQSSQAPAEAGSPPAAFSPNTQPDTAQSNLAVPPESVQSETPPGEVDAESAPQFVMPPDLAPDASESDDAGSAPGLEMPPQNAPNSGSTTPSSDSASDSAAGSNATAGDSAEVRYATWREIQQSAAAGGQITVIDLWSLACPPCLKEFPGLVRLHEELGDQVRCVGFDLDYDGRQTRPPESYQPQVTQFLASVDAEFENYISQTPIDDVLAAVGIVSIPAVLVYDAKGNLVQTFTDSGETAAFTYDEDIIPLIRQLAG